MKVDLKVKLKGHIRYCVGARGHFQRLTLVYSEVQKVRDAEQGKGEREMKG